MDSDSKIVVTGLGAVTPIGLGVSQFWDALLNKKNGVRVREELKDIQEPLKLYSPIEDFDGKQWVRPRKALKVMCRPIQFGYAAAAMALEQSGLLDTDVNPNRLGTVFGSETFYSDPQDVAAVFQKCMSENSYVHDRWGASAIREIQPLWMLKYLPNMVSSHISIMADARGPSNSICQGSVSGILALIEGAEMIRRGICDAVIVGGTGTRTSLTNVLCRGQQSLSRQIDHPEMACRPFDADRDGVVFGEGAGAIVIESEAHAKNRNAKPLVRLDGWTRGFVQIESDSAHVQLANHFAETLKLANCDEPTDCLSHVNANASGSIQLDAVEAKAIHSVAPNVPVVAIKSNFGNLGAGSSMIELIASFVSLGKGIIPPTRNFQTNDPECPVEVNVDCRKNERISALKSSFSSTGQIASVCFSAVK